MFLRLFALFTIVTGFVIPSFSQDLDQKAQAFLNSLSDELREQAVFPFNHEERTNMNYVPLDRKGPRFRDFNEEQMKLALDLLHACLSTEGIRKVNEIIDLERYLYTYEDSEGKMSDGQPRRDPLNYHFCIFGDPEGNDPWGWRFEGHHVSLNFTSDKGVLVSGTPAFYGSNPGTIPLGEMKGKTVLKMEMDLGFKLLESMSESQMQKVRFADKAPYEIITANHATAEKLEPLGISYNELNVEQRKLLRELVDIYIDNYQFGFSERLRKKVYNDGIENLYFAWAGSLQPGEGHYYRIQGPDLLIEYANTQNDANHIHTVTRELSNDFARDILKKHYKNEH